MRLWCYLTSDLKFEVQDKNITSDDVDIVSLVFKIGECIFDVILPVILKLRQFTVVKFKRKIGEC